MSSLNKFRSWFDSQNLIVKIILLIIPGVNWVIEILLRLGTYLKDQKNIVKLVLLILVILPISTIIGILDAIVYLVTGKLLLE